MSLGLTRDKALAICGISKNQFYYQSTGKVQGMAKSIYTYRLLAGQKVCYSNEEVIEFIKKIFSNPKIDYGYRKMSGELQLQGFYINHKKVYRLMREGRLLQAKKKHSAKDYVKYRIVCPAHPLKLMEMDIKQVWVEGERRTAYILTILDVFTRACLYWAVGYQMRHQEVQKAWEIVIEHYLQGLDLRAWQIDIEIRSDNGPQFGAKKLKHFLEKNYLLQTFTHPYTPEENGHIESFHSILERDLQGKYFENLAGLSKELNGFYNFYDYERLHGSLLNLPPITFWHQWELGNIDRIELPGEKPKVRFKLKIAKQEIQKIKLSGNESQREVLSLNFLGFDTPKNSNSFSIEQNNQPANKR